MLLDGGKVGRKRREKGRKEKGKMGAMMRFRWLVGRSALVVVEVVAGLEIFLFVVASIYFVGFNELMKEITDFLFYAVSYWGGGLCDLDDLILSPSLSSPLRYDTIRYSTYQPTSFTESI